MVSAKDSIGRLKRRTDKGLRVDADEPAGVRSSDSGLLVGFRWVIDLPGIFHELYFTDIDVDKLAILLLDLANIDVLNDVALDRVDLYRPAWAVELLPPQEIDVFETVGIRAEGCHRLLD